MSNLKLSLFFLACTAWGATRQASSCAVDAVRSAINAAAQGDTVTVPAGNCSWSGLTLSKPVRLQGAGIGQTNITLTGKQFHYETSVWYHSRFRLQLLENRGWKRKQRFNHHRALEERRTRYLEDNDFTISSSGLFRIEVAGGVIIAKNSFTGGWDDFLSQIKDDNDCENSWSTPDTLGNRDTTGKLNHYIENNTFYGGTNQGIDADDSSRVVYRYNNLTYSSFNSHGWDTSPVGVRHFEVYKNTFRYPGGSSQIANQSWAIWIRGGSGVIFENQIDNIAGSYWGDKPEVKLSIRGAEDVRPQGSCGNTKYAVPRQIGQNHNGTSYFTDPLYFWGNTGTMAISAGWNWNIHAASRSAIFSNGDAMR